MLRQDKDTRRTDIGTHKKMKKFKFLLFVLFISCLTSCSKDDESKYDSEHPYIGLWKGTMNVYSSDEDRNSFNTITVEYSLLANGRFEQIFSGLKTYSNEDSRDAYVLNRGNYIIENDILWLYFDYMMSYGGSNSDNVSYVDQKETDGNWYRSNFVGEDYRWDEISKIFPEYSPQFVRVGNNKYKIVYLNGEDSWKYKGKLMWKMPSNNNLVIYLASQEVHELCYSLTRK